MDAIIEQGRIFWDLRLPGVIPAERTALYVAAVEVLAKLHSLELASLKLDGYGKGIGYCRRQVIQGSLFTIFFFFSCGCYFQLFIKKKRPNLFVYKQLKRSHFTI